MQCAACDAEFTGGFGEVAIGGGDGAAHGLAADIVEAEGRFFIVRLNGLTAPHRRTLTEADRSIRWDQATKPTITKSTPTMRSDTHTRLPGM